MIFTNWIGDKMRCQGGCGVSPHIQEKRLIEVSDSYSVCACKKRKPTPLSTPCGVDKCKSDCRK